MRYTDKYQDKQSDRFMKTLQDFCKRKQEKSRQPIKTYEQLLAQQESVSKSSR